MQKRERIGTTSPTANVIRLTGRIKPLQLGRRMAEQVGESDFRGATLLCRRALGAGRTLRPSWNPDTNGRDEEQHTRLRQLLSLVENLRLEQRRAPHPTKE